MNPFYRLFNARPGQLALVSSLGALFPLLVAQAQTPPQANSVSDQLQTPIPGAGHDYEHLLAETVNFSNGSVNIKIAYPRAPGRGITLPYAWSYNSARVFHIDAVDGITPVWNSSTMPLDSWDTADGLPTATVQVWSVSAGLPPGSPISAAPCNTQSGMTFTDMSGVMHNLNTGAQASPNSGTAVYICGNGGAVEPTPPPNGDGQVVGILDKNTATNLSNTPSSVTSTEFEVMDKDGTTYWFASGATMPTNPNVTNYPGLIEDRNGNMITTNTANAGGFFDTAGHQIPQARQPGDNSSFTIDNLTYTPTWLASPVSVSFPSESQGYANAVTGCGGGKGFPTTVTTGVTGLSTLALPNHQTYQFSYDPIYGLINQITYPDGGWVKYTWKPSSDFNELVSMGGTNVTGTAGEDQVVYHVVSFGCLWQYKTPVLLKRQVSFDGTKVAQTLDFSLSTKWKYAANGSVDDWSEKTTTVTTTDNNTGLISKTVYTYTPYRAPSQPYSAGYNASSIPLEHSIAYYDWGKTSPTKTVTKTWLDQFNLKSEMTTDNATGQVSGTIYSYTSSVCATNDPLTTSGPFTSSLIYLQEQDVYDFGTGGLGPLRKRTIYTYHCFPSTNLNSTSAYVYTLNGKLYGPTIAPRVSSVTVEDGSGAIQSATQYGYDASGSIVSVPSAENATQHDPAYETSANPPVTARGNLTSVTRCNPVPSRLTAPCSGPTVTYTYDSTGQPASMTDANGNTTTYSFADNFSDSTSASATNAYLTKVTRPGINHILQFGYRYADGLLTSSTDMNGNATIYSYANDPLNRLTSTTYPLGGGQTTISYVDTAPSPMISTTQVLSSGTLKVVTKTFDGMWHQTLTATTDPVATNPDASGSMNYVSTGYDGEGRVLKVSNPYWTSPSDWTYINYDALGRKILQKQPDGGWKQWCYDNTPSTGLIATRQTNCHTHLGSAPADTYVDAADENSNDWQETTDAFGRLIQVAEPNGTSQRPSLLTVYGYDTLNNLTTVNQMGGSSDTPRLRFFSYDSLSRLIQGYNPESGWTCYGTTGSSLPNGTNCSSGYDGNGNLKHKTDARSVTTNYTYDALNRILSKSYSNDASYTPWSCYLYDTATNGNGLLAAQWTQSYSAGTCPTAAPTTGYLTQRSVAYDLMGRITSETQATPASQATRTTYAPTYSYDLAGNLLSWTDGITPTKTPGASLAYSGCTDGIPSSTAGATLTFSNCFDAGGHLLALTTNGSNNTPPVTLFSPPTSQSANSVCSSATDQYSPFGALMNATLGSGISLNRAYDNRLRMVCENDIGTGATPATSGSATVTISGAELTK